MYINQSVDSDELSSILELSGYNRTAHNTSDFGVVSMSRNPNWTRDELILALDLYSRVNTSGISENNPEIVALSELLNALPIHRGESTNTKFRNPNGIYMKLCNFLRLDPNYSGVGLSSGSKLDEVIWNEYANDLQLLKSTADSIRYNYQSLTQAEFVLQESDADNEEEFPEGNILTRLHKIKERNPAVIRKKKQTVLKATGKLACEVCGFDFETAYGKLGTGFAECHHTVPLSELKHEQTTRLIDLAIVCANCHRMLHRTRPTLTVQQLREYILN